MNVLVTGGAGYIGSHACKALAAEGYLPITYDNLCRGHRWAVKWGPLEEGNIGDEEQVRAVLEKYQPIALMHFAAFAYVGESVLQPLMYYENNFAATAVLLRTILAHQRIPIVFSSSCATYGMPDKIPISEDQPQRPINPYGTSKLFVERLLFDLDRAHGLPCVALRYFNAAGADPDREIGEAHDPETHLIPLALRAIQTGVALPIFGTDYDTPDGTCIRDYVHVSDIADAHVRALNYLLGGNPSCALNLANARGYSVKEVGAAAEKVCGAHIHFDFAPRRPGDPPILIGDACRAHTVLKWHPTRSDIATQIEHAWAWMQRGEMASAR